MLWIIALLILVGIALLIIEVVFIPGTTVVGLLGVLFMIAGISFSYSHYGPDTGFFVLIISLTAFAVALFYSFKKGAWKKFSLEKRIESRVNEDKVLELKAGMEGTALSALRPSGNAEFNGEIFEVTTRGDYLAPGSRIRILHIQGNVVVVESAAEKIST
jgi:membrane-bound ClpP family serine protease